MSEHPWVERFREEGWLDLHRLQLCDDLVGMGHAGDAGLFWILTLLLANSSGSLCVPVDGGFSRIREILGSSLPEEGLNWWLNQAIPFDDFAPGTILQESSSGEVPFVPLICKDGFLFFQAHFYYRQKFLESVQRRSGHSGLLNESTLLHGLSILLDEGSELTVEQLYAVLLAGALPLALITGGPGSGKTSTIYAILKLALRCGIRPDEIRIAAPTGRAASRVLESLEQRARSEGNPDSGEFSLEDSLRKVQSSTIHRLLGVSTAGYYHDANLPLPARLIIVDELSMVDVTLMGRLLEAVNPEKTTLVLLGDPDQLPSVEAGAVIQDFLRLEDVDSAGKKASKIYSSLHQKYPDLPREMETHPWFSVFLQGSHRFGGELMDFAGWLRNGELTEDSLQNRSVSNSLDNLLEGEGVVFIDSDEVALPLLLMQWFQNVDAQLFDRDLDPAMAFQNLNRSRILSPLRKGPFGVESVNRACSQIIMDRFSPAGNADWFSGMPVMLHRNDNVRRLYNGDTGIVGPSGGELLGYFPSVSDADSNDQKEISLRSFQRDALPSNEPAFCHTIHKSQGSEYDVVLILLGHSDRQRLNRELLYTALTRARKKCILYGKASEIAEASRTRLLRETGLS